MTCVICSAKCQGTHCFRHKPRRPLQTRTPLKANKRLKKAGKLAKAYGVLREQYLEAHPAPWYCYYCLFCGIEEPLEKRSVNIEHFYTKNDAPELRFKWANLVISCPGHNALKAQTNGPEFLKLLEEGMKIA